MIQPISPAKMNEPFIGPELEMNISKINEAITTRNWHSHLKDEIKENWNAVVISPYDTACKETFREALVSIYKEKGWDCKAVYLYDARGPHYAFLINKSHFK